MVGKYTDGYGVNARQLRMANSRAENAESRAETAEREERRHMTTAKRATADLQKAQQQQADADGAYSCIEVS